MLAGLKNLQLKDNCQTVKRSAIVVSVHSQFLQLTRQLTQTLALYESKLTGELTFMYPLKTTARQ